MNNSLSTYLCVTVCWLFLSVWMCLMSRVAGIGLAVPFLLATILLGWSRIWQSGHQDQPRPQAADRVH